MNAGGDHILRAVNALPCCKAAQSPAAADLQDLYCLASAFLDFESSALAEPISLSSTDQLINRIKRESPAVTASFKLAYSVSFLS